MGERFAYDRELEGRTGEGRVGLEGGVGGRAGQDKAGGKDWGGEGKTGVGQVRWVRTLQGHIAACQDGFGAFCQAD